MFKCRLAGSIGGRNERHNNMGNTFKQQKLLQAPHPFTPVLRETEGAEGIKRTIDLDEATKPEYREAPVPGEEQGSTEEAKGAEAGDETAPNAAEAEPTKAEPTKAEATKAEPTKAEPRGEVEKVGHDPVLLSAHQLHRLFSSTAANPRCRPSSPTKGRQDDRNNTRARRESGSLRAHPRDCW